MPTQVRVCAWLAAVGLAVPPAANGQDRTEREIVELIVRHGLQAAVVRAGVDIVQREQAARLVYANPEVTYSREGAGFTEFLQLGQPLPPVGARAALARAGAAAAAAAEAQADALLWNLRADAAGAAARLVAAQARTDAALDYVREVERLVEILRVREREGEGSRFDRLRAEQELQDARQAAAAAGVDLAGAGAAVSAMLPPDVVFGRILAAERQQPDPALLEPRRLLLRAATARADLRALRAAASHADREADASRRARGPAPTIFGGVKRAGPGSARDRGGVFGVSVSLSLFDAGGREAARWMAARTRMEAEHAALERQIHAEIVRAAGALALRQRAVSADIEGAGDELARIAEVAYREGEMGVLELLDAVRTASRARLRTIDLRLEERLAEIALERAVGEVLWP